MYCLQILHNTKQTDSRYNAHTFTMGLILCQKWLAQASGQQDFMWRKINGRKGDFQSSKHSKWTQKLLGFFLPMLCTTSSKNSTLVPSQWNDIGASVEVFFWQNLKKLSHWISFFFDKTWRNWGIEYLQLSQYQKELLQLLLKRKRCVVRISILTYRLPHRPLIPANIYILIGYIYIYLLFEGVTTHTLNKKKILCQQQISLYNWRWLPTLIVVFSA